ncbi:MAG: ATP-binding protein [Nitrospirota bacterium]
MVNERSKRPRSRGLAKKTGGRRGTERPRTPATAGADNRLRPKSAGDRRDDRENRRTDTLFRGLLEAAPDAILLVNPEGNIVLANAQTEVLLGYRRDELVGHPVELLIPDRVRERHVASRRQYIQDPKTRPMGAGLELAARRKDGTEFPVEISLSPMRTDDGTLIISILRDVTERKRAEEQLRAQARQLEAKVREMDDFTHVVSHDLKEPLRGIEAFAGFLLEDYGDRFDDQGKRYLNFLKQSAVRMKDLIHDLLTLAALSRKAPTSEPVDLNRAVAQAERDLAYAIQSRGAEIRYPASLPTVVCDATQLRELLKNLISNAIKFNTSQKPVVTISSAEDDRFVRVAVADNGIGIDQRYRDRIFELFERLHAQEEFEGTGAGLAICKKIVEGCGGRIWVESEPGKGSTFLFTLPAARKGS